MTNLKTMIAVAMLNFLLIHSAQAEDKKPPKALLVVEQAAGRLGSFDSNTGQRLGQVLVGENPHEIEVSPDGKTAYVSNFGIQDYDETIGTPGNSISVIDLQEMREKTRFLTGADSAPHGLKLRPPLYRELFVNVEKGHAMLVFDVSSGKILRRLPIDSFSHNFQFSPDGQSVWLMAGPSGVIHIDAQSGAELGRLGLSSPARGLSFSPDQQSLLVAGRGELGLFDTQTYKLQKRFTDLGVGQILYAVMTPDGSKILAPAVWEGQVLVIDVQSGQVLKRILTGLDPVAVALAPSADQAVISNARALHLSCIDLQTFRHRKCVSAVGPNGLAFGARPTKVPENPVESKNPALRFGVPLPLSGRESYFGRELLLGYEFWKESINAEGGLTVGGKTFEVEIEYEDTRSDLLLVKPLGEALIDRGVKFLLGTYNSPANGALADVAQTKKVPLVTSAGAGRSLYQQGNSWLFGIQAPASEYLKGSLHFVAQKHSQVRTVGIVVRNAPAPLEDAKAAAKLARELGLMPFDLITYSGEGPAFSKIVTQLAEKAVDFVLFAGDLADAENFVKESAKQEFHPKGFSFSVGPSLPRFSSPQGAGPFAAFMLGSTQWTPAADIQGQDRFHSAKAFAGAFWNRYFSAANYLSAGAVATGLSFEDAIVRAGSLAPEFVRQKLAEQEIATFYGPIAFDKQGLNVQKPIYTIQLQPARTELGKMIEVLVLLNPKSPGKVVWPFPGFGRHL